MAIIGSGPAGLAAAHDLALMGFRPTVYEMEPVPAGMLAVGIPEYRLPRDLIAAEVEFIRALGVEFICNTQVGRDISLAEIRAQHRATIVAIGLKRSRSLPIPGADGEGVLGGIEHLRDVALGRATDLAGQVVVIGGGNVAYDVARTVVRQTGVDVSRTALREPGVLAVHLCTLESLDELPADDDEIIEGDQEGVIRHHSLGPKEIVLDDQRRVRGVVFQRCIRVFDDSGRFAPQFDETDLTTLPADRVIWAIGQRPDLSFLKAADDIQMTERGLPSMRSGNTAHHGRGRVSGRRHRARAASADRRRSQRQAGCPQGFRVCSRPEVDRRCSTGPLGDSRLRSRARLREDSADTDAHVECPRANQGTGIVRRTRLQRVAGGPRRLPLLGLRCEHHL